LILVIIGLIFSYVVGFEKYKIAVVGHIPSGLPTPNFRQININDVLSLYQDSIIIPIGMSSFSSLYHLLVLNNKYSWTDGDHFCRQGSRHKVQIRSGKHACSFVVDECGLICLSQDIGQDLMALGLANTIGSMFGSYPCMGAFGRTALQLNSGVVSLIFSSCGRFIHSPSLSGGKTQVTSMVSSMVVMITLLLLTGFVLISGSHQILMDCICLVSSIIYQKLFWQAL
jgi:hypothetical protein